MNSLLARQAVRDFERKDVSRGRIVTRAAYRLESQGFEIVEVTTAEMRESREQTYCLTQRRSWKILFVKYEAQQIAHEGFVQVDEVTRYIERTVSGRNVLKLLSFDHFFVADGAKTERMLRLSSQGDPKAQRSHSFVYNSTRKPVSIQRLTK